MTVLVDKLEKELARNCRLNNWDLGFQAAIDIVKKHSEWVSVNERLPDIGQRVLTQKGGYVTICSLYRRGQGKLRWDNGTRLSDLEQYTHWMPIPKPPSEVQNV